MIFVDGVDGRVTVARVDEHFALRRTIAVKRSVLSRSERRLQLAMAGSGSHEGRKKSSRNQGLSEELHGEYQIK